MKTVEIAVEASGKLLRMSYAGTITGADMEPYAAKIDAVLPSMQRGFYLLTDLSGLEAMDLSCVPHIQKTMELLRDHGVSRVVRIIPSPEKDIGFSIMSLFHYSRDVQTVTCENLAQAEQALR